MERVALVLSVYIYIYMTEMSETLNEVVCSVVLCSAFLRLNFDDSASCSNSI